MPPAAPKRSSRDQADARPSWRSHVWAICPPPGAFRRPGAHETTGVDAGRLRRELGRALGPGGARRSSARARGRARRRTRPTRARTRPRPGSESRRRGAPQRRWAARRPDGVARATAVAGCQRGRRSESPFGALATPLCLSGCHARSGARRRPFEAPAVPCRSSARGVLGLVVGLELALSLAGYSAKNAHVNVGHDRPSLGSGSGSDTAAAKGDVRRTGSALGRCKPMSCSRPRGSSRV